MSWTDPNTYLGAGSGHSILGGLSVLFTAPAFAFFGMPYFLLVLVVPIGLSIAREWWQFRHEGNTFQKAIDNISEWMLGALVFAAMIGVAVYFGRF